MFVLFAQAVLCLSHPFACAQDLPENDALPGGGQAGEDDARAYRQLVSRRKSRGLQFLKDKLSSFHLLLTVALAMVISAINSLCFQCVNADLKGISLAQPVRKVKRQRKRMQTKGAEAFMDDDDMAPRFISIFYRGVQCTANLWKEIRTPNIFATVGIFWPSSEPEGRRCFLVLENILQVMVALKWRILQKFCFPPWSLAELEGNPSDEIATCHVLSSL